jgi:hypothetical protein
MKIIQIFFVGICILVSTRTSFAVSDVRPDLSGRIVETNGAPIAKATVLIYTAAPKQGTSALCPYCYADCQKKAKTDADGRFKIESLDPALIFRLLVVSSDHESKIVSKVNPAEGEQKITLKPLTEKELTSSLRIKGMIIDENGQPIPDAVINTEGVDMGMGTQWGGTDSYVEPMAVANDQGQFVLFCKNKTPTMVHAVADGRGVAKQWVSLKPGNDYLIHMLSGVTVTGRILLDGKPLKGAMVGLVTSDRIAGNSFECDAIATDSDGHFMSSQVPPNREFICYVTMKSLHGSGAVPNKTFITGDSGSTRDIGNLSVQPAFTVAGRIILSDGKPIPSNTKLYLGRQKASDSSQTTLAADGKYEFSGVPAEPVVLSLRIKGYKFSKTNPSLDWLNGDILGRVAGDTTNLDLLMEPGQWQFNQQDDRPEGVDAYPVDKPLRGVLP